MSGFSRNTTRVGLELLAAAAGSQAVAWWLCPGGATIAFRAVLGAALLCAAVAPVVILRMSRLRELLCRTQADIGPNRFHVHDIDRAGTRRDRTTPIVLSLSGLIIAGFAFFSFVVYRAVERIRINGPLYEQIIQTTHLTADVLPPREHIVETHLLAHRLLAATIPAERERLTRGLAERRAEFEARSLHWANLLPEGELRTKLLIGARTPARRYFEPLNSEYLPLVEREKHALALEMLTHQLDPLYEEHRAAIDGVVALSREQAANDEHAAARESQNSFVGGMFLIGGAMLAIMLTGLVWVMREIGERAHALARRMTADLRQLSLIAERTTNAVIITDCDRRIVWTNEGFARLTDYTLEQAAGRKPGDLLRSAQTPADAVEAMRAALDAGRGCRVQLVNRARSGSQHIVDCDIQPLRDDDGTLTGYMAVESDVTAQ